MLVDTNVLIYTCNEAAPQHAVCKKFLDIVRHSQTPWYLAWQNIYEFLCAVTSPRLFETPMAHAEAMKFLKLLIENPYANFLVETNRHMECLDQTLKLIPNPKGVFFYDVHLAALCLEHGIRTIATFDVEFRKFPFLEVVIPS